MPKVSVQRQADRREEILAAAQSCFARAGFHQTSINDICAEAGMSAGNLYRYFPSKEAIITGIAERNSAEAAESFAEVSRAENFFEAFGALARFHLVDRSLEDISLCAEVMAESRRNPHVAKVRGQIEAKLKRGMADMLRQAASRGEMPRNLDFDNIATMLFVLGDGIFWQRAVDPNFDAEAMLPMVLTMVQSILKPQPEKAVGGVS